MELSAEGRRLLGRLVNRDVIYDSLSDCTHYVTERTSTWVGILCGFTGEPGVNFGITEGVDIPLGVATCKECIRLMEGSLSIREAIEKIYREGAGR